MHKFMLSMLFFFSLALPAAAQSIEDINATIDGVLGDHEPYAEAFEAIQTAVAANEAETVAQWVAYPFNALIDDETYVVEDAAGFVAQYDAIVTDDVREIVANQRYEDLFVNADGVMFGNGQMWLNGVCRDAACAETDVKIVAIQGGAG